MESFVIKTDALTPDESKNSFPAMSPDDEELMTTLYQHIEEDLNVSDSEDCEHFQKLNELRLKYPNNPVVLNFIANVYHYLGKQDQMEKLVAETYERFPDYLFGQTAQASIYLKEGFPEKALEVLRGAYTLKQLYPHRTVFHVSEVKTFEYFMVNYFCETRNVEQARLHLQILEKVLEEDDVLLVSAQKIFKRTKALYNFKARVSRLLGLTKREKKNENER